MYYSTPLYHLTQRFAFIPWANRDDSSAAAEIIFQSTSEIAPVVSFKTGFEAEPRHIRDFFELLAKSEHIAEGV